MSTTIFIALQCCQCSTMQVKQQKKSSNKWTCVVCNQKQSVRKVFAQGFMARDVRKFVQTYNMSRQFAEQQQWADETLSPISEEIDNQLESSNRKKKRTDWTEYIDPDDDPVEEEQGDVFEPKFVTELPKALFKKPKLDKYTSRADTNDGNKPLRPVFSKRNSNKRIIAQDEGTRNCQPLVAKGASKWSDLMTQDKEDIPRSSQSTMTKVAINLRTEKTQVGYGNFADHLSKKFQPSIAKEASKWSDYINQEDNHHFADKLPTIKLASKWSNYITEDDNDDDDLELKTGGDFTEHTGQLDDVEAETILNYQKVEEDIHPDFM